MRQHFIDQKYSVVFDEYTEKCYIKEFRKKYKKRWEVTELSIKEALERISKLSGTNRIDVICTSNRGTFLAKYDFKIAKTDVSAKGSGNRCILEVCNESMEVRVLLVYCKDDIGRSDGQETLWWKEHVSSSMDIYCA